MKTASAYSLVFSILAFSLVPSQVRAQASWFVLPDTLRLLESDSVTVINTGTVDLTIDSLLFVPPSADYFVTLEAPDTTFENIYFIGGVLDTHHSYETFPRVTVAARDTALIRIGAGCFYCKDATTSVAADRRDTVFIYASTEEHPLDPRAVTLDLTGIQIGIEKEPAQPISLDLEVWPNPAPAALTIRFRLPKPSSYELRVFDVIGRDWGVIGYGSTALGAVEVWWDAERYPRGAYFVRLQAGAYDQAVNVMLVR